MFCFRVSRNDDVSAFERPSLASVAYAVAPLPPRTVLLLGPAYVGRNMSCRHQSPLLSDIRYIWGFFDSPESSTSGGREAGHLHLGEDSSGSAAVSSFRWRAHLPRIRHGYEMAASSAEAFRSVEPRGSGRAQAQDEPHVRASLQGEMTAQWDAR